MRALFALFFILAGVSTLCAQEQERKLADRIRKPDMSLEYDTRKSSYRGTDQVSTGEGRVKDFQFQQKYRPGEFSTREFRGSKSAWMGDFVFSTKEAQKQGRYEIPNVKEKLGTTSARVKDARESQKSAAVRPFTPADRTYAVRGRSQDRFDQEKGVPNTTRPLGYGGDLKVMTIDDVRELLNKNK